MNLLEAHPEVSVVTAESGSVFDPGSIETDGIIDSLLEHDPVVDRYRSIS